MAWLPKLVFASLMLIVSTLAAEEVVLNTSSGSLHGTLLLAPAAGRQPVVLIIAGSGPTDRNGNSALIPGRNDALKMLAEGVTARGIATLRYDKRGVQASAAAGLREENLRFDTYVDDAAGWLRLLAADSRFSSVSVAGHSEGSLVAMVAAQKSPVARVISIAGAGQRASDLLLMQLQPLLPPDLFEESRWIIAQLTAGQTVPNPPAELVSLFRPSVQPYLISWFRYDPALEATKLTSPLLVIHGTTDIQLGVEEALRLAPRNGSGRLVIIPGMNHVLKDVPLEETAQQSSYSDPTLPINHSLVSAIDAFIDPAPRRRSVKR